MGPQLSGAGLARVEKARGLRGGRAGQRSQGRGMPSSPGSSVPGEKVVVVGEAGSSLAPCPRSPAGSGG